MLLKKVHKKRQRYVSLQKVSKYILLNDNEWCGDELFKALLTVVNRQVPSEMIQCVSFTILIKCSGQIERETDQ